MSLSVWLWTLSFVARLGRTRAITRASLVSPSATRFGKPRSAPQPSLYCYYSLLWRQLGRWKLAVM